ncbi:MAG: glycosyltransferase family 2 protein [Bacteroidales bacterium]|nr:glycosyltransferase family 2 protein [Bacteroidales bacterium]MDD3989175.1 glycosyltransferase family 2 protein [Bacteroidales bacterium]
MSLIPEISVIILNYNGLADTQELLESLFLNSKGNFEVLLVDNGSDTGETTTLSQKFKDITIIRTGENLGFAGGNNRGIIKARGRYILLLNNDTLIIDDSVNKMAAFMEKNPAIGALSPRLLYNDQERTLQYAGYTRLSLITLRNKCLGMGEADRGQYMEPSATAYTHGAAMMVRREVIEKSGVMEEDYFLYYEEMDWCERIKKAGYEIWYYPGSSVIHKESRSTGKESAAKSYYMTRNRLMFAERHRKGIVKIFAIIYLLSVAPAAGVYRSLAKGRRDNARAILFGVRDFLINRYGKWQPL